MINSIVDMEENDFVLRRYIALHLGVKHLNFNFNVSHLTVHQKRERQREIEENERKSKHGTILTIGESCK